MALVPPFRAKDMNGLYKKVTQGQFEEPPKNFSPDLVKLISSMIKINPKDRPSCDQILRQPEVITKMKQLKMIKIDKEAIREERRPSLLQTIKLPKNLKNLDKRLPKSQYETVSVAVASESPNVKPIDIAEPNLEAAMKRKRRSVAPSKQQTTREGEPLPAID